MQAIAIPLLTQRATRKLEIACKRAPTLEPLRLLQLSQVMRVFEA